MEKKPVSLGTFAFFLLSSLLSVQPLPLALCALARLDDVRKDILPDLDARSRIISVAGELCLKLGGGLKTAVAETDTVKPHPLASLDHLDDIFCTMGERPN